MGVLHRSKVDVFELEHDFLLDRARFGSDADVGVVIDETDALSFVLGEIFALCFRSRIARSSTSGHLGQDHRAEVVGCYRPLLEI